MIVLDKEMLEELLKRAYDAGWAGCKELRNSVVEELLKEVAIKQQKPNNGPVTDYVNLEWVVHSLPEGWQAEIIEEIPVRISER